jgi:hypothetical protein
MSIDEAMAVITSQTRLQALHVETVTAVEPGDEFRGRPLPLYRVISEDLDGNPLQRLRQSIFRRDYRLFDLCAGESGI